MLLVGAAALGVLVVAVEAADRPLVRREVVVAGGADRLEGLARRPETIDGSEETLSIFAARGSLVGKVESCCAFTEWQFVQLKSSVVGGVPVLVAFPCPCVSKLSYWSPGKWQLAVQLLTSRGDSGFAVPPISSCPSLKRRCRLE